MAEKNPSQTVFGYEAGRKKDCLIGNTWRAVPVTIYATRCPTAGKTVKGPRLWVRGSVPPYYAYPYGLGGEVASSSGAAVTLERAADAANFKVGDQVAVFKYASEAFAAQVLKVSSIVEATGVVTLDTTPTSCVDNDFLVVVSGADCGFIGSGAVAEANTCVILEDVVIVDNVDQGGKAYIEGTFVQSQIAGITVTPGGGTAKNIFNVRSNPVLHMIDIDT